MKPCDNAKPRKITAKFPAERDLEFLKNEIPSIRLQVFLSRNGVCSRRKAMDVIQEGRVTVNGKEEREPSRPVTEADDIRVDGRRVGVKTFEYVLLHKPAGYVTTKEDCFAKKTVLDLLPAGLKHLHPVGRLDKDTEGLLLLTNDGDLTQKLTHPRREIDKVYVVRIRGRLTPQEQQTLEQGIVLEGRRTAPAKIQGVKGQPQGTEFLMTIHEGRKRQIRLMLQAVGHEVIFLKRVRQGPMALGNLARGSWRLLTADEINKLKET